MEVTLQLTSPEESPECIHRNLCRKSKPPISPATNERRKLNNRIISLRTHLETRKEQLRKERLRSKYNIFVLCKNELEILFILDILSVGKNLLEQLENITKQQAENAQPPAESMQEDQRSETNTPEQLSDVMDVDDQNGEEWEYDEIELESDESSIAEEESNPTK